MENFENGVIRWFDWQRRSILKVTMSSSLLRSIYQNPNQRIIGLSTAAFLWSLFGAIFFPVEFSFFGIVIYGIPHLLSSFRYSKRMIQTESDDRFSEHFKIIVYCCLGIVAYRLLHSFNVIRLPAWMMLRAEVLAMMIMLPAMLWSFRKSILLLLIGAAIFLPFALVGWNYPIMTVGAVVFSHHFVAFYHWYKSAKHVSGRRIAISFFLAFVCANFLIFFGVFDNIYDTFGSAGDYPELGLSTLSIARQFFAESMTYETIVRFAMVFCLGQSMHFFIWLKAIPEQYHPHEHPPSLRQSYKLLLADVGEPTTRVTAFLFVTSLVGWLVWSGTKLRGFYFTLAVFHTYLEVAVMMATASLSSLKTLENRWHIFRK